MTDSYDNQIMILLVVSGIFFLSLCRFVFAASRPSKTYFGHYQNFIYPSSQIFMLPQQNILGLLADFQLFPQVPDFKYIYTIIDMLQFQFRLRTFK